VGEHKVMLQMVLLLALCCTARLAGGNVGAINVLQAESNAQKRE
jgi:hypothetical protein